MNKQIHRKAGERMEDLKKMIGQHFVVGFPGTSLEEEFIQLVKEYKIGNVILFRRNVESIWHQYWILTITRRILSSECAAMGKHPGRW